MNELNWKLLLNWKLKAQRFWYKSNENQTCLLFCCIIKFYRQSSVSSASGGWCKSSGNHFLTIPWSLSPFTPEFDHCNEAAVQLCFLKSAILTWSCKTSWKKIIKCHYSFRANLSQNAPYMFNSLTFLLKAPTLFSFSIGRSKNFLLVDTYLTYVMCIIGNPLPLTHQMAYLDYFYPILEEEYKELGICSSKAFSHNILFWQ